MDELISDLKVLRARFDIRVSQARLRAETEKRYRSWTRRFIRYSRNLGLPLTQESAQSFLRGYESLHSKKQGYYALKFLFVRVGRQEKFFEFVELNLYRPRYCRSKRKWWWYNDS